MDLTLLPWLGVTALFAVSIAAACLALVMQRAPRVEAPQLRRLGTWLLNLGIAGAAVGAAGALVLVGLALRVSAGARRAEVRARGLDDPAAMVRADALDTLGAWGVAADAPQARARLRDPAPEVRAAAIRAVGRLQEPTADVVRDCCRLLADEHLVVDRAVRDTLEAWGAPVAGLVRAALRDSDPDVRFGATVAGAAAANVSLAIRPALVACLTDAEPRVRCAAIVSCVQVGPGRLGCWTELATVAMDPDPDVGWTALWADWALDPVGVAAGARLAAREARGRLPAVLRAATEARPATRLRALRLLAAWPDLPEAALAAAGRALADPNQTLAIAGLDVLRALGPRAAPAVDAVARAADAPLLRQRALEVLVAADAAGVAPLVSVWSDEDAPADVRGMPAGLRVEAVGRFLTALQRPEWREKATGALMAFGPSARRPLEAFAAAAGEDGAACAAARAVLAKLAPRESGSRESGG